METKEIITWQAFKETLLQNPLLDLQFQYAENKWIGPSYHITEIKQAPIVSVDCGGKMNTWTEVIIQLWEPQNQQQERAMKVRKALSIIAIVEKALILNPQAIVKIEFGNAEFDTRQMVPNEFKVDEESLVIDLRADTVQCKAIERGGNCGTISEEEECCSPTATVKPILQLKNNAENAAVCCEPGSGCC
jgi:hypothetical protein